MTDNQPSKTRAVYEVLDPLLESPAILEGRGCLDYPVVLWVKDKGQDQWSRCSPVIELNLARRWHKSWKRGFSAIAITPAHKISRTIQLPFY